LSNKMSRVHNTGTWDRRIPNKFYFNDFPNIGTGTWSTASTKVTVFPVPGGPKMM
jgi:hypothetical protein